MHFSEHTEGDYRIYAGALEARGGYVAAVVVTRMRGVPQAPKEAYRDLSMSGGHRWEQAAQALTFAVLQAKALIRKEPDKLAC